MIKNRKTIWVLLVAIILLAGILRLWQLGGIPPSPDWDEAALGYNAFSILQTGRDEFGKFLPVVLRSFDDYKPALYAYITVPSVLIFGLDVFAVRLPSAIIGTLTTLLVFFLVREIFEKNKYRDYFSLASAFLFAISPWSIQFSRVAFESNIGVALNVLVVLFFLKGLKKPWMLSLSALFAGLCIYAYQSEKVFTPLLILALVVIYRKKLFSLNKKYILSAVILGIIVVAPMALYILGNRAALLRVTGTSIFSYQTELLKTDIQKLEHDRLNNDKLGLILDNRRITYAKTIVAGYISHFDPNWLFVKGDIARHHAPNMGLLYLFEFPFLFIGIYGLIFGKFDKKAKLLIFSWFLIAPIPASITSGVPHAVRTLNFLPTFQILTAIGIFFALQKISNIKYQISKMQIKYLIFSLCILFFIFNFLYYLNQYFVQQNYYNSQDWQYGYQQTVDEVLLVKDKYKEIVVSNQPPMDQSYMFFLFYLKYPPADYQKIGINSSGEYAEHHYFGKYTFRPIDWQKDSLRKGVLYIGNPGEISNGASTIKTIYNLDGTQAIRIVGI
ncbi:MAG: glycosyltransferase family 39 protein [Patescibacteria group bacterium]